MSSNGRFIYAAAFFAAAGVGALGTAANIADATHTKSFETWGKYEAVDECADEQLSFTIRAAINRQESEITAPFDHQEWSDCMKDEEIEFIQSENKNNNTSYLFAGVSGLSSAFLLTTAFAYIIGGKRKPEEETTPSVETTGPAPSNP